MRKITFLLVASLVVSNILIAQGEDKAAADNRRAIEEATRELDAAYCRGDFKGAAAAYAENGRLMPPNEPIFSGRAEIEKYYKRSIATPGFKNMESILTETEVHNDVAFSSGTCRFWQDEKSKAGEGKFVLVWKKSNGKWQIYRDCGNSNAPVK